MTAGRPGHVLLAARRAPRDCGRRPAMLSTLPASVPSGLLHHAVAHLDAHGAESPVAVAHPGRLDGVRHQCDPACARSGTPSSAASRRHVVAVEDQLDRPRRRASAPRRPSPGSRCAKGRIALKRWVTDRRAAVEGGLSLGGRAPPCARTRRRRRSPRARRRARALPAARARASSSVTVPGGEHERGCGPRVSPAGRSASIAASRLTRPAPYVSIAASPPAGSPVSTTIASGRRPTSSRCQAWRAASRTTRTTGRPSARRARSPASSADVSRIPSAPGHSSASPCAKSPAAMFACGTSSTTNGACPTRSACHACGARVVRRRAPISRLGATLGRRRAQARERANPAGRLLEPCQRQPAVRRRPRRARATIAATASLVQVVADAERVRAGGDRAHRSLLDAHAVGDRAHLERVRDHEPVEPELVAQQPREDPPAQRRRHVVRARGRAGARSSPP